MFLMAWVDVVRRRGGILLRSNLRCWWPIKVMRWRPGLLRKIESWQQRVFFDKAEDVCTALSGRTTVHSMESKDQRSTSILLPNTKNAETTRVHATTFALPTCSHRTHHVSCPKGTVKAGAVVLSHDLLTIYGEALVFLSHATCPYGSVTLKPQLAPPPP